LPLPSKVLGKIPPLYPLPPLSTFLRVIFRFSGGDISLGGDIIPPLSKIPPPFLS
jgi:hypothetical protein